MRKILALAVIALVLYFAWPDAYGQTYQEITAGTFDPYYERTGAPLELYTPDPAPSTCVYCTEMPRIQPYDERLIQTAPGQIQSEDGYRIWVQDVQPTTLTE